MDFSCHTITQPDLHPSVLVAFEFLRSVENLRLLTAQTEPIDYLAAPRNDGWPFRPGGKLPASNSTTHLPSICYAMFLIPPKPISLPQALIFIHTSKSFSLEHLH